MSSQVSYSILVSKNHQVVKLDQPTMFSMITLIAANSTQTFALRQENLNLILLKSAMIGTRKESAQDLMMLRD